jgi:hypothetical protein
MAYLGRASRYIRQPSGTVGLCSWNRARALLFFAG